MEPMAQWGSEIHHAARMLRRSPGFTAMATGAIALGIGACTAIFSVVNKVLLEPLPYPAPERLVQLMTTSPLGNRPEPLQTARVSADYFRLFGAQVEVGRTFDAREDGAGGPRVAVISDALWRHRFGSKPGLVGSRISLERRDCLVIGILAAGFRMDPPADLWLPLKADESAHDHMSRVRVVGRLR